jgi:hypothetical protein
MTDQYGWAYARTKLKKAKILFANKPLWAYFRILAISIDFYGE